MKRFLTSVSLQHEPKASDVITLVKKTFVRTRSDIKIIFFSPIFFTFNL